MCVCVLLEFTVVEENRSEFKMLELVFRDSAAKRCTILLFSLVGGSRIYRLHLQRRVISQATSAL